MTGFYQTAANQRRGRAVVLTSRWTKFECTTSLLVSHTPLDRELRFTLTIHDQPMVGGHGFRLEFEISRK